MLLESETFMSAEEMLNSILATITNVVWSISAATYETLYLNPAAEQVYGRPADAFYKDPGLFLSIVHPEDRERVSDILPALVEKGSATLQYRIIRPDGEVRWLEDKLAIACSADGRPVRFDGVATDVTERLAAEGKLNSILATITNAVWSISAVTYETLYLNPAAEQVYGRPADAFYKDPGLFLSIVHPEDRERVSDILPTLVENGSATLQYRIIRPDGEVRWLEDKLAVVRGANGKPMMFSGVADDITERKEQEAKILHIATHDVLTSLPNRKLFNERLHRALARSDRNKQMVALMFCDLDRFKEINDTLGHEAGDALLTQVAERLKDSLRTVDTIARIGGDEFTIIAEGVGFPEAAIVGQKIVSILSPAFIIMGKECLVSPSVGIALYPADAGNAEDLISCADKAMYYVKRHGRNNYKFYKADPDTRMAVSV